MVENGAKISCVFQLSLACLGRESLPGSCRFESAGRTWNKEVVSRRWDSGGEVSTIKRRDSWVGFRYTRRPPCGSEWGRTKEMWILLVIRLQPRIGISIIWISGFRKGLGAFLPISTRFDASQPCAAPPNSTLRLHSTSQSCASPCQTSHRTNAPSHFHGIAPLY